MSRVPIRLPKSREREKDIQKTILEGLTALRIWHVRMNSGAMFGEHAGKKRMLRFGRKGMADILAAPIVTHREKCWSDCMLAHVISYPVLTWLEVKRSGEKQTDDQIDFQYEVEDAGHRYFVVHSWEEVLEVLK